MSKYRTSLHEQCGKKLLEVTEVVANVKVLLFDDGTQIEIESHPQWTPAGSIGIFEVRHLTNKLGCDKERHGMKGVIVDAD